MRDILIAFISTGLLVEHEVELRGARTELGAGQCVTE